MKEKTSVTLSSDVLAGIDQALDGKGSRSAFIEDVLRQYLKQKAREERNKRDLAILNRYAAELNAQAEDLLDYQAPIEWETEA